jgi:opacity protein-like surface antigen
MKRFLLCAMVLVLFSMPAFAKDNSEKIVVPRPVKAGSTQLSPGNYDITWTGTGSDVKVSFLQRQKVLGTVSAKLTEHINKNEGLETSTQGGVEVLQIINLKNVTLTLENSTP